MRTRSGIRRFEDGGGKALTLRRRDAEARRKAGGQDEPDEQDFLQEQTEITEEETEAIKC